jgi:hypothetical protein
MHRWRFQWLVRWLIPTFTFVVAVCAVVIRQKASSAGLAFLDDSVYRSLSVARALLENQVYAFQGGERIPAVQDALWRVLLAVVGGLSGDLGGASYLLGAACGMVTLLICFRLARLLFPFPPYILYSSILLIAAPRLLADAVDGTPAALATMLVTAACLLHIEGLSERGAPLPMAAAWLCGILMWIRIEFGLLWLVFSVHAFILSFTRSHKENPVFLAVTRSLTGVLILALCMFPLLAWNFEVIRVPWPQAAGAPFTLDVWLSATPAQVLGSYFGMAGNGILPAFSRLYSTPFLSGLLERVLTWFGVLFIAGLSMWRKEERPYTVVLFLLALLPPFYALIYPYMGWQTASLLFSTLGPLCVLVACFGIFRAPFLVENLYRRWKSGLPAPSGFAAWWITMGSLLLLVSLLHNGALMRRRIRALEQEAALRRSVLGSFEAGHVEGKLVATDAPGWLSFASGRRVLDLTGEFAPEVLACLGSGGRLDPVALETLLKEKKPDSLVIWTRDYEFALPLMPHRLAEPAAGAGTNEWPKVAAVNWYGVF